MTPEQLSATIAAQDARLAATRTRRISAPKKRIALRSGHPDQVYDLVSGRPVKMLGREAVEKRLRRALKALGPEPETGLTLSRALDLAELASVPESHPLVERCADALGLWESRG